MTTKNYNIIPAKHRECPACGGDGWIDGAREVLERPTTECPFCRGRGFTKERHA